MEHVCMGLRVASRFYVVHHAGVDARVFLQLIVTVEGMCQCVTYTITNYVRDLNVYSLSKVSVLYINRLTSRSTTESVIDPSLQLVCAY